MTKCSDSANDSAAIRQLEKIRRRAVRRAVPIAVLRLVLEDILWSQELRAVLFPQVKATVDLPSRDKLAVQAPRQTAWSWLLGPSARAETGAHWQTLWKAYGPNAPQLDTLIAMLGDFFEQDALKLLVETSANSYWLAALARAAVRQAAGVWLETSDPYPVDRNCVETAIANIGFSIDATTLLDKPAAEWPEETRARLLLTGGLLLKENQAQPAAIVINPILQTQIQTLNARNAGSH